MILLGLLREPACGYDLKRLFDLAVRHFWAAELSQIYRALKRLELSGLLKCASKRSPKGPERVVYSLTAAGRRKLRAWLGEDPKIGDERYAYVAQLFFMAELSDLKRTAEFVEQLRAMRAEQLDALRGIERELSQENGGTPRDMSDDDFHRYLTLRAGLATAAARVAWCDEALERIRERAGAPADPTGNRMRRKA